MEKQMNLPGLEPNRKKAKNGMVWMKFIIVQVLIVSISMVFGWLADKPGEAEREALENAPCGNSLVAVHSRNIAWEAINSNKIDLNSLEVMTALILKSHLNPTYTPDIRVATMNAYVNLPIMMMDKKHPDWRVRYAAGEEKDRLFIITELYRISLQINQLTSCLLSDTKRIDLILAGQPVPPEPLP